MKIITTKEAAKILGVSSNKQVRRYVDYGLLNGEETKKGYHFEESKVIELKKKLISYKQHNSVKGLLPELFVLDKHNAFTKKQIIHYLGIQNSPVSEIDIATSLYFALNIYSNKREREYLNSRDVPRESIDDVLLVGEACSRLKMKDTHIIYNLMDAGEFKKEIYGNNRQFVNFKSFKEYLGDYANQFLFRSHEVEEIIDKSISEIDRLAKQLNLGLKVGDANQSNYLFSPKDIKQMYEHDYCWSKKKGSQIISNGNGSSKLVIPGYVK